jgi:hypothetical protein
VVAEALRSPRVRPVGSDRCDCGRYLLAQAGSNADGGRRPLRALDLFWARADDVSKSRRLGLASLSRELPFEGLDYARPGVTLAPVFFVGAVACQSRTVRT